MEDGFFFVMVTIAYMALAATINVIIFAYISSLDSQSALLSSYISDIDKQYSSLLYNHKPQPQPTLIQQQPSENENEENNPISFTVYHTSYSDSTLQILRKHFNSPNTKNYLYEDTVVKAVLGNFSSEFNFIIGGTSHNEIIKNKFQIARNYHFDSNDIIVYDIENRPSTPKYERMDPVSSISKVMQTIRSQGYKAGVTPYYEFITTYYKEIE